MYVYVYAHYKGRVVDRTFYNFTLILEQKNLSQVQSTVRILSLSLDKVNFLLIFMLIPANISL